ncbi:MAG TPA: MBL fold metallo-hydrolase [Chromatiales bacterium]|nr:MBL fold metallo-hydrolase [Thiotrichales bacterium]HIP68707.1 MBL fold metallo-hydrolase [Chromatiales bacterium]
MKLLYACVLFIGLAGCGSGDTSKQQDGSTQTADKTTTDKVVVSEKSDLMANYKTEKIAANTFVIHGPLDMPNVTNKGFMNNPGFVVTGEGVVVLDPGSTVYVGEALLKRIAEITDKPVTHIFNSHVHGDHWLANDAFAKVNPNVKIYAHPEMIKEASEGGAQSWLDLLDNLTEGASRGTKAVIPAEALSDGQEIKIGGVTFRVHLSEIAHTKTDAMIEVVEERVLFAGDILTHKRMTRMEDGSFRGNIAALDKAMTLDVKVVVPGHGPTGGKEIIKPLRDYLNTIYSRASEMREEGLEDFEMKDKIAAEVTAYESWPGFEENFGKQISLAVLESEQAEFE